MNIKIEWNKIVVNTLSVVVAAIILGAATIVWDKAMSVDTKVQGTREDMTHLIDTLSGKLAGYQIQLGDMSNQLAIVIENQSNVLQTAKTFDRKIFWLEHNKANNTFNTLSSMPAPIISELAPQIVVPTNSIPNSLQQKVYTQEIKDQLKR
jgi:hypothetical protein